MDPEAALAVIRSLAQRLVRGGSSNLSLERQAELGTELAEDISSLDEWLTKGGFPPPDWRN